MPDTWGKRRWSSGFSRQDRLKAELQRGRLKAELQRGAWYMLVVVFFALGLLSKPMLVTLPLVLLLLDYWPLGRRRSEVRGQRSASAGPPTSDLRSPTSDFRLPTSDLRLPTSDLRLPTSDLRSPTSDLRPPTSDLRPPTSDFRPPTSDFRPPTSDFRPPTSDLILLLEKLPLFLLSAASCVVTYLVQSASGVVSVREPWGMRLQTALTAYVGYLVKMAWPFDLAVRYPRQREPAVLATVACGWRSWPSPSR